jgi:protein-S-isoprenylcysteine O-methyltransferase Ste14
MLSISADSAIARLYNRRMLDYLALGELFLCWILWVLAFLKPRKQAATQKEVAKAGASRWGLFLVMLSFACVWAYIHPPGFIKAPLSLICSMVLGPFSVALVWWATRHLGKQWRFQAAVSEGHELIETGPYALIRHPIYTSMLGMMLATGAAWTWWPMFVAAICFFIAGTEVRIHAEERLLAGHFGGAFAAYRFRVRGYIPFVR